MQRDLLRDHLLVSWIKRSVKIVSGTLRFLTTKRLARRQILAKAIKKKRHVSTLDLHVRTMPDLTCEFWPVGQGPSYSPRLGRGLNLARSLVGFGCMDANCRTLASSRQASDQSTKNFHGIVTRMNWRQCRQGCELSGICRFETAAVISAYESKG